MLPEKRRNRRLYTTVSFLGHPVEALITLNIQLFDKQSILRERNTLYSLFSDIQLR